MERPVKRLKSAAEHEEEVRSGDTAPTPAPAPAESSTSYEQGQQSIAVSIRAMCANLHRQNRMRLNAPAGAPTNAPATAPAPAPAEPSTSYEQGQESTAVSNRAMCANLHRKNRMRLNAPAGAPANAPAIDPALNRAFYGSQGSQTSFAEGTSSGGDTEALSPPEANNSRTNLASRIGPEIQFGECGRKPRWVVVPTPYDVVNTFHWMLEAGTPNLWNGLTHEQLVEYAYMYLEHALEDTVFRDRFRWEVKSGSFSHLLVNLEDALPPLPDAPITDWFGGADERYFYYRHQSPFVALRPGIRGYQVNGNSPIIGGRRSVESPNGQLAENEQAPSQIVETARPSVYHNGVQEQPPQLTRAQNHTNGHPNGRPFHKYIYMGPSALAPRHMVNEPLSNPPNGLPRADFSDVMPRARTKQTSKKTAQTLHKQPNADKPVAEETEFMGLEREALDSLKDEKTCAKTFPRRTFRRFRPWAGYKDATRYINKEDLARLPRFPMAQRAFNPLVGVRAAPTSKTSRTSKIAKIAKTANTAKTATTATTATTENTARTPETSNDGSPRRNPPRNRRKPKRYLN